MTSFSRRIITKVFKKEFAEKINWNMKNNVDIQQNVSNIQIVDYPEVNLIYAWKYSISAYKRTLLFFSKQFVDSDSEVIQNLEHFNQKLAPKWYFIRCCFVCKSKMAEKGVTFVTMKWPYAWKTKYRKNHLPGK